MSVVIDTPVWSLALRRKRGSLSVSDAPLVEEAARLIQIGEARLLQPVRQEVLSGIALWPEFVRIRDYLRDVLTEEAVREDYEEAAVCYNTFRSQGISASAIDCLICSIALNRGWFVFTTDRDFERYSQVVPLRVHGIA